MELLPIVEAAQRLGIHPETLRRRIRRGEVNAHQEHTTHGDVWLVEVDDLSEGSNQAESESKVIIQAELEVARAEVQRLEDLVLILKEQLEGRDKLLETRAREVQELHVLLQRAQAALPAPKEDRQSWWRRLWQRQR